LPWLSDHNYSSPLTTIKPERAVALTTRAFFFSNPPNIRRLAVGGLEKKNAALAGIVVSLAVIFNCGSTAQSQPQHNPFHLVNHVKASFPSTPSPFFNLC
jgi:hypothetical protein